MALGFLTDLLKWLFFARARQQAADLQIADRARLLLRQLSNLPDWPSPPVSGHSLSGWAASLLMALRQAGPNLTGIVKLHLSASPRVRDAIGSVRDDFERAVALLEALFGKDFSMTAWEDDRRPGIEATLRKALGDVRGCETR